MSLNFRVIAISVVLGAAAGIIFAINLMPSTPRIEEQVLEEEIAEPEVEPTPEPGRAELVARALVEAYPGRILAAEYRDDDWAVLLRDTWFYFADGRMLPEDLRHRASEYSPIAFYNNYNLELPPWNPPSTAEAARLSNLAEARATVQPPRAPHFFDTLYRSHSGNESYERVKTLRFLGFSVTVHYSILEELSLVEEQILRAARTDPAVQTWIANIQSMAGWSWRSIVGSQSRSFHAYGVALDIMPGATGGRAVFWQWAGPDWFNIPYERRHHPPDAVINAFESYGFVWGGRWLFFDTIHFEYRPEVFILNGHELSTLR
ncbi:MAG: M15 family metallopeptidase [Treponema sp.]|nr:M15 family metallopeptidase [Treponema sp.]